MPGLNHGQRLLRLLAFPWQKENSPRLSSSGLIWFSFDRSLYILRPKAASQPAIIAVKTLSSSVSLPAASMAAASAAAPSPRPPSSAPSPRLRRDCRLSISLCIVKRGRGENMLFAPLLDWACNLSERPYRAAPRHPRPPSQCVAWQCRGATDGGRGQQR